MHACLSQAFNYPVGSNNLDNSSGIQYVSTVEKKTTHGLVGDGARAKKAV